MDTTVGLNADAVLKPETYADGIPHALFAGMRAERPVWPHGERDGQRVWSITGMAPAREVSHDWERFTSTRGTTFPNIRSRWEGVTDDMAVADPPRHTRLRSFAGRTFTPPLMRRLRGWVEEVTAEILDEAQAKAEIDIVKDISQQLPSRVITRLLGVPLEDRAWVIEMSNRTFGSSDPEVGPSGAKAAREAVMEYGLRVRDLRLREPTEDMATALTRAEFEGDPITEAEYAFQFLALLTAGYETTHSLLTHSFVHFSAHPELFDTFADATEAQWAAVVEEMLRVTTPIMQMSRTATRETSLGGEAIGENDIVIMWYSALNRDPDVFAAPDEIRFDRNPNPHSSFGAGGPHFCLGNQLARLEARVMIAEFARRGLRLQLTAPPARTRNMVFNGVASAPATWA